MGIFSKLSQWLTSIFGKKHVKIGIYGPPNAGKTTLALSLIHISEPTRPY